MKFYDFLKRKFYDKKIKELQKKQEQVLHEIEKIKQQRQKEIEKIMPKRSSDEIRNEINILMKELEETIKKEHQIEAIKREKILQYREYKRLAMQELELKIRRPYDSRKNET